MASRVTCPTAAEHAIFLLLSPYQPHSLVVCDTKPPHSTMKPLSAFATASLATAALYAREDVVPTIVTTLPDTTGVTTIPGTTIETTITRTLATIIGTSTETSGTIDTYTTTTSFASVEFSISCSSEAGSSCNELTEATTKFPVEEESFLSYTGTSTSLTPPRLSVLMSRLKHLKLMSRFRQWY